MAGVKAKPGRRRAAPRTPPNVAKAAVPTASSLLPSQKHERFAEAIASGRSVTAAYLELYPGKTDAVARAAGSRLLAKVNVTARVAYLSSLISKQAISAATVTKEWVLTELARVAGANMGDFLTVGPDGLPRLDWKNLTREQKSALAEVTVDTIPRGGKDDANDPLPPVVRVKFKLHPKLPALEQLGKHLKLYTDVVEHTEPEGMAERREAARTMMMRMLDLRAQGKLPPEMVAIMDEWAGVKPKQAAIEAKAVEVKR